MDRYKKGCFMAHGPSRAQTRGPATSLDRGAVPVKKLLDQKFCYVDFSFNCYFSVCKDKRCKTCKYADPNQIQVDKPLFCKTSSCIYMITCLECGLKYIGQTCNNLNLRLNGHRSDIKLFKIKEDIELKHFQKHSFGNIFVNIIEICEDYKERMLLENYYMTKFGTLYPYGLNNLFNGLVVSKKIREFCVYSLFVKDFNGNKRRARGRRGKRLSVLLQSDTFVNSVNAFRQHELNLEIARNIKRVVFGTKNKIIVKVFKDNKFDEKSFDADVWCMLQDLCKYKLGIKIFDFQDREVGCDYLVLTFQDKMFDQIGFNEIIGNSVNLFPIKRDKSEIKLAYKYKKTIGRMMFNYNELSKNCPLYDYSDLCYCKNYGRFVDDNLGHVVTGNLDIVENITLREIMLKGSNFRPRYYPNYGYIIKNVTKEINLFCLKVSYKYSYPFEGFTPWIANFIQEFKVKLKRQLRLIKDKDGYNSFNDSNNFFQKDINNEIKKLQDVFVITMADKAGNNFAIMCKKLYYDLLHKEYLHNDTFDRFNDSIDIFKKKITAFYRLLKLKIDSFNFPYLFITVKFHKDPIGFRFITCGTNSYSQKASIKLQEHFKVIIDNLVNREDNFVISNNQGVIRCLEKNSDIIKLDTYDFESLFTNIPHRNILEVFDSIFEDFQGLLKCSRDEWFTLIKFCVFNNVLYNGRSYFLQNKGIPMGSSYCSSFANIYLYFFEIRAIKNFGVQAIRYIDDLCVFNGDNFDINWKDIYPNELKLKKTNSSCSKVNFLDLSISINEEINNFKIDIFDKRDDFNFEVISLTNWFSNVSIRVLRNIIVSYLSRIERICNCKEGKINEIVNLRHKLNFNKFPVGFVFSIVDGFESRIRDSN